MKTQPLMTKLQYFLTLLVFCTVQTVLWAQEGNTESSSTTSSTKVSITEETSTEWYTNPIVWIIGAAVFILLLVALLRGGGGDRTATRTDTVVHKERVVRDGDADTV
jgi:hypothetical protein